MALIGFGNFSKYYTYIFILVVFRFLCDYLEGFNTKNYYSDYYDRPVSESFIEFGSILSYHPLFRDFFYFFGSLLCGLVLYIIYRRNEKENQDDKLTITQLEKIRTSLLGGKYEASILNIIIIAFIYAANIGIRTFLMSMKFDAGFWTLEILFVIYLTIRILKLKIGNHQKVTIFILACILFSIQIINSLLPQTDHDCQNEKCRDIYIKDNNMYTFITKKFGGVGFVFLILFLYIFDFMMRDYSWVRFKYLMDVKSVPVFKVMMFIGISGVFIVIICLCILTNVPCNVIEGVSKIGNNYIKIINNEEVDFSRQTCGVIDYDQESKKLTFYYDNFYIFNSNYSDSTRKGLEIFVAFLYFINNFFINFSQSMILKHLDPNAMLVNVNFNYLFSRLITYIKNKADKKFMTIPQFILLELCEILAIVAYMIYIELIELKFCRLDYDLKKNIGHRGLQESLQNSIYNIDDDDDDKDNDNNPKKKNESSKTPKEKNNSEISVEMIDKNE